MSQFGLTCVAERQCMRNPRARRVRKPTNVTNHPGRKKVVPIVWLPRPLFQPLNWHEILEPLAYRLPWKFFRL